jgi:quercetin dioxygenase-like cupin family protein
MMAANTKSPTQYSVEIVAQATTGIGGQALAFPPTPCEVEAHVVEVVPRGSVGRHQHPTPCVMFVLQGTIVAKLDDGTERTYRAGECFIEDAKTWVDNVNPGETPARFFAVVVGDAGAPKITGS